MPKRKKPERPLKETVIVMPAPRCGKSAFLEHEKLYNQTMEELYKALMIPPGFLAGRFKKDV